MGRFKPKQFIPYFLGIQKEYDLSGNEMILYGFLFNHCEQMHENWYCGLNDYHLAQSLDTNYRSVQRQLKNLKEKGLIEVQDSKTIYRKIYITDKPYALTDGKPETEQDEIKRLRKEVEQLKQVVDQQKAMIADRGLSPEIQLIQNMMIEHGLLGAKEEVSLAMLDLIADYRDYVFKSGEGSKQKLSNHFAYVKMHIRQPIQNKVQYLRKAFKDYLFRQAHLDDYNMQPTETVVDQMGNEVEQGLLWSDDE